MDALYQKFYKTFTLSTQKFDKWYHFQKQDVLDQRTTHRKKLNELTEKIALVKEQNLQYKENELRLAEAEEKRKKETEYQKAELQKILDENSTLMEKKKKLEEEIKLCRQDFEKRSEALLESKGNYQEQLKKNEPELKIFEDKLAWKIKTIKTDNIKFSFTHINETNWDEEFSFVLDVSEPMYKVADCIPLISDVDKHVEELNQFRDLFTFLKNMRISSAAIKIDNHDSLHYNEILSKKNFYRRQSEGDLSASLLEFNNVNESEDDNSSTGKQQDDVLITLLGDTKLSTKSVDINSVHSMKQSSDTNIKATLPMHSSTKSSLLETTKVSNIGGDERQALSSVTFNLPSASASASASSSASSSASTSVPSSASSSAPSSASSASEISPSDIPNQLPDLSITKTSQIQRKHIAPKTVPAETNIFSVNDSFTQNDNDAASIKTTFSRISTPQPSTSAISNAATKIEPSPTPNLLGSGVIIQTTSVESNLAALLQNAPLNNMVADTPFITFNADKETSSLASEFPTPTDSILPTPDFDISANTFSPNVMPMDTENKPDIPKDTEQQQTSKGQSSLLESTGSKVLLGSVTGSVVVVGAIIGSILISKKKRRKNNILKYNDSSRRGSPDSFNEKYFQDQPKPNLSENASLHISQLTFATNNSREVFRSNVNSNNNYFNNSKYTIDSFQKPTLVTLDRKLTLIPENTVESGHFAIDFTTMPRDKSSAIEIDEKYKSIYSSRTKKSNSYSFSVAGSDLQSFSSGSERIESVYSVETFSSYDDGKRESTYSEYNMPINYDSVNYNAFHF